LQNMLGLLMIQGGAGDTSLCSWSQLTRGSSSYCRHRNEQMENFSDAGKGDADERMQVRLQHRQP